MKWQFVVALEIAEWAVFIGVMPFVWKVYRWLERQG